MLYKIAMLLSAVVLAGCSKASHNGNAGSEQAFSAVSGCQQIYYKAFQESYYPFVKTNCSQCHTSGPGSGFFASGNAELSFNAFQLKGSAKIAEFAVSSHKPPYTGSQHTAEINTLKSRWAAADGEYNVCVSQSGGTPPPPTGGSIIPLPTKMMIAKTANPVTNNQTVVLTWNTGTEFMNAADALANAQITLTVRAVAPAGGVTAYQFENPRLVNNSGRAAVIKGLAIYVNDTLVDGETFMYVDRYVPGVANNNTRRLAPGAAYFASTLGTAINVKIAVGVLAAADIDFNPPTYQTLTAAGGIFANSCVGCHSVAPVPGGVTITANSYNLLVGRTGASDQVLVSPYTLLNNHLYGRMNTAGAPMPPAGLLPQADRDRIRDWILDGAPLNAAAIAR